MKPGVRRIEQRPPRLSLAKRSPAPTDTVRFYDGSYPALEPKTYTIQLTHTVAGTDIDATYTAQQSFTVSAPGFSLDPTIVESIFPPDGSTDSYDQILPSIVLTDVSLPWERAIDPSAAPAAQDTTPWLALILVRTDELILDPLTRTPITQCSVSDLVQPVTNVVKPSFPAGWISADALAGTCEAITIPGAVFEAVMPALNELPYLAHCRCVDTVGEAQGPLSVVLCNRLAVGAGAQTQYSAHLVSLEGLSSYLSPGSVPAKTGAGQTGLMDVMLVSLFHWTFVSLPEPSQSFESLMAGLVAGQSVAELLQLPVPSGSTAPTQVIDRLNDGYVALDWITGAGDTTFGWYRGPLAAGPAQPVPTRDGLPRSSDALLIYLADQGVFDLSYAEAWEIGRAVALADNTFSSLLMQLRREARACTLALAQRAELPPLAGLAPPALLAPNPTRHAFARKLGHGLVTRWTAALADARSGRFSVRGRGACPPLPDAAAVRALLARPEVGTVLVERLAESMDPIVDWLKSLYSLRPLPFNHLVPDARMLPPESIRFFYVDQGWLESLVAGAFSMGVQSSFDAAVQDVLLPVLRRRAAALADQATPQTGFLIRSQVVAGWPNLVVAAQAAGSALPIARIAQLADDVLLCLINGVPETLSLSQPYRGLCFGLADEGVQLRSLSGTIGQELNQFLPSTGGLTSFFSTYCRNTTDGVLKVVALATDLGTALTATIGASDFALQLLTAPEQQAFGGGT